jgi:predicted amidophosphoribosyltransferase
MRDAYDVMLAIKGDTFVGHPPIPMSDWIANVIRERMSSLPFAHFFQPDLVLVPVPKSSLMQPHTLWVPLRIATALAKICAGSQVDPCLIRTTAVRKAALSKAPERPKPKEHYDSLRVQQRVSGPPPKEILLVDDIITRGSTLIGSASRLAEAFPGTRIRAFGAMTTISRPSDFVSLSKALIGSIQYRPSSEDTLRRP